MYYLALIIKEIERKKQCYYINPFLTSVKLKTKNCKIKLYNDLDFEIIFINEKKNVEFIYIRLIFCILP